LDEELELKPKSSTLNFQEGPHWIYTVGSVNHDMKLSRDKKHAFLLDGSFGERSVKVIRIPEGFIQAEIKSG